MNVHRAADQRPRRLGVHHVENRVDDLVAAGAEDRGAEDGAGISLRDRRRERPPRAARSAVTARKTGRLGL
jgi:hypothetical protein